MKNWSHQIDGCFSSDDYVFAGHPADETRARKMLGDAMGEGVGFKDYCNTIKDWLRKKLSSKDPIIAKNKIKREMKRVKDLSTYFPKD